MLQIRKEGNKNFTHIDTVSGNEYIASDVTISANNNQILITKEKGSAVFFKIGFDISEVQVYDDTSTGALETFSTPTALFNRLIALGYPAFYEDGQITLSLNEILDVNITALEDGQFLAYNESTGFWENVSTNPASSVAWDELTGSPSDSAPLVALINDSKENPSYEPVDFGTSLWATSSTASTDAEINALINAQGFEIELGVLYKFYIGTVRLINGKYTLFVENYVFGANNVLGTYGTGSTNGEVSINDFLNTNSYQYISLPTNNERVDLGEIGATPIYTYINNLDTTGLDWETLADGKSWYFYATVSGVAKVYAYTGVLPRDVGSAYSGADPLLDTDFDLQDTENGSAVTSVNGQIGAVVLDADDIDDASTTNKFTTSAEISKLSGIEAGAEVNTIDSITAGEPSGSDTVLNVVSLTQAEYDAGTPIATTFYIITDA